MKKTIVGIISIYIFMFSGCGCKNESPSVTLINNGLTKASIQIKTSNGNTENINNVDPGWRSDVRKFAAGNIEFTVTIQGVTDPVVYVLLIEDCMDYTVVINPNNSVSSSSKERN